jgi:prevent-host-death family protein
MKDDEIGAYEAKTHLPRLLREVSEGARYTITHRGVPIARLIPVQESERESASGAVARLRERRAGKPRVSREELRDMVWEGRRR